MKRLFFSVLALTIGAFAFVSCDKDDDEKKDDKREKGSYLSMQDQQDILSDALIKAGDQVEFESLSQRVRTLVYSFAGHQLNVDTTYAQLLKDELAARKIGALRDVKNISDLNPDELYFGVDLALEESVTGLGDTVMLAMVKNINHNTDRFIIKEKITYPTPDEEAEILNRIESGVITKSPAVLSIQDVDRIQDIAERVYVDPIIKKYISLIVGATRQTDKLLPKEYSRYVRMGASPRASIAFMKIAKAVALIYGRNYVTPDDVKLLRYQVLRHRIELNYSAVADNVTVETIIDQIVNSVKTP